MPEVVSSDEFGKELGELLGIQNMTYCCFIFDWGNQKPVRANVEYLVDGRKITKLLELLTTGKWRQVEI